MPVIRAPERISDEQGVTMVLLAMVGMILFGVAAMVIHYGYLTSMQAELQSAADAAALAASSRLNSTQAGWDQAREAAVKTFEKVGAINSVTQDKSLKIDGSQTGTLWDLKSEKNLMIRIERGSWREGSAFESNEADWQALNPGIPGPAIANAVRVTLERPETSIPLSFGGNSPKYDVAVSSTAVNAPTDGVCVAPFAVPVCSVLDKDGKFDANRLCRGDRLFTRADRYCHPTTPGYPNCKSFPSSPYTLVSSVAPVYPDGGEAGAIWLPWVSNDDWLGEYSSLTNPPIMWRDLLPHPDQIPEAKTSLATHFSGNSECGGKDWGFHRRQEFSATNDHYGVFGIPGNLSATLTPDQQVTNLFAGGEATKAQVCGVHLGDPFHILSDGLTSKQAEDFIWKIINNGGKSAADSDPSFYERYGSSILGSIEGHIDNFEWMANPINGVFTHDTCPVDYRYKGACNSRRGQYVLTNPVVPNGWGFYFTTYSFRLDPALNDDSAVWKVKIPVIAQTGTDAASCAGISAGTGKPAPVNDPIVDPDKQYKIVGFVDILVYDVDIGNPPPDYQIGDVLGKGTEPFPVPLRFQEACNNVRARISCDSKFLPSSEKSAYSSPHLVP